MNDREKLINLIMQRFVWKISPETEYKIIINSNLEELVDHLIAHGVTVKAMQRPLTVAELPEYHGKFIWKEEPSMKLVPVKMFFVGSIAAEYGEFGIAEDCESLICDYNYSWRCWAEKPTEEEKRGAEWL